MSLIFQTTCKIEDTFDHLDEEKWSIGDLQNLTNSPYLKHPIWFLGTLNNSKCPFDKRWYIWDMYEDSTRTTTIAQVQSNSFQPGLSNVIQKHLVAITVFVVA